MSTVNQDYNKQTSLSLFCRSKKLRNALRNVQCASSRQVVVVCESQMPVTSCALGLRFRSFVRSFVCSLVATNFAKKCTAVRKDSNSGAAASERTKKQSFASKRVLSAANSTRVTWKQKFPHTCTLFPLRSVHLNVYASAQKYVKNVSNSFCVRN